jgi:hypothetical protein
MTYQRQAKLVLGGTTYALDMKGGIRYRVEADLAGGAGEPGGRGGVKLRIIGHELHADHGTLGRVTLAQADNDTTPLSLLEVIETTPPAFRVTIFWDATLTIEKPPGGDRLLVLTNLEPGTSLHDELRSWPPQGATQRLKEPVEWVKVGSTGPVVATLTEYAPTESHNP